MFSLAFLQHSFLKTYIESSQCRKLLWWRHTMASSSSVSWSLTSSLQATNQNPPWKNLLPSFSESFISSGKQGGGATVLREGHNTVTREACIPTSLNVTNLGKAAVLHFASPHAKLSL
jgi:hypothetical protein